MTGVGWAEVVQFHADLVHGDALPIAPMLELVNYLASTPRYARVLQPRVVDGRLTVTKTDGTEELRIAYEPASRRFVFTHLQRPGDAKPWSRDCEAVEWRPVLERILHKRVQWFHEG